MFQFRSSQCIFVFAVSITELKLSTLSIAGIVSLHMKNKKNVSLCMHTYSYNICSYSYLIDVMLRPRICPSL